MIIINGDRCSGRTTKAINYVENHPDTILVVPTMHMAKNIQRDHRIEVISSSSFDDYHYRMANKEKKYFIDDFDMCFKEQIIGIVTRGEVVTLKADIKTLQQLRSLVNSLGKEKFNECYPSWRIE